MKNERQANIALQQTYEANQWKGSLGEKREPHKRPGFFKRKIALLSKLLVPVRKGAA